MAEYLSPTFGAVGEQNLASGVVAPVALDRQGAQLSSELHGRYVQQALRKHVYMANAIVTAPVIFSTAAGTGGPLLYNPPTSGVNAAILAVSCGVSVVSTVAASLGLTGGATNAPTSTTAIDSLTNTFLGGPTGQCSVYRVGTPSAAGTFFHPFGDVHTGALTVDNLGTAWIDIGGVFVVPPGYFASIAASATASTLVANLSMLYEEIPV